MNCRLSQITKLGEIPPGTQIAVKKPFQDLHKSLRNLYFLFSPENYYCHHGVYLGDQLGGNCQVLHFSGADKNDATLRTCDILEFLNGAIDNKVYRVNYDTSPALPVEQIVQKAREVLANLKAWPAYQVVANNCETFAAWLTTGEAISVQATKAVGRVTWFLAIAGGAAVASIRGFSSGN